VVGPKFMKAPDLTILGMALPQRDAASRIWTCCFVSSFVISRRGVQNAEWLSHSPRFKQSNIFNVSTSSLFLNTVLRLTPTPDVNVHPIRNNYHGFDRRWRSTRHGDGTRRGYGTGESWPPKGYLQVIQVRRDQGLRLRSEWPYLLRANQHTAHRSTNMPLTRKKYRKMRIKFDDAMTKSNEYFNQERKAAETAKRLKQYNEWATSSTSIES